jgi:putative transposase
MSIVKTYKYRLKLSKNQESLLDRYINTSRAVYNLALETKVYAYQSKKVSLSKFDLMRQLTECRAEFEWMKEVPSQSLQYVIERMDKAYQSFFKGGGFPKWARKDKYNSLTFKKIIQVSDYVFKLPKIGTVTIFKDRQPKGELRNATIARKNGKYYISIVTQQEVEKGIKNDDSQIGIDVGINFFASLSNSTQIENPRHTLQYAKRLRVLNRSLARKRKGSKQHEIAKLKVFKMHEKLSNTRKDFLHKQSSKLIKEFDTIVVENLKVKNMIKFGYLSKQIADVSWSEFFNQLEYKSKWNGNTFLKIDPKYTSQTCFDCGKVDKKSRISQSKFVCTSCGVENDADINASNNILRKGIAIIREREALACA